MLARFALQQVARLEAQCSAESIEHVEVDPPRIAVFEFANGRLAHLGPFGELRLRQPGRLARLAQLDHDR